MTFALMAGIFGLYCTDVLGIDPHIQPTVERISHLWLGVSTVFRFTFSRFDV